VDADLSHLVGGEAEDLLVGAVQSKPPSGPAMEPSSDTVIE
jgi:hypothetical protein